MPPTPSGQNPLTRLDVDHMLPPRKAGSGPVVGIIIIVLLLMFGALYFWGGHLSQKRSQELPLIPGTEQQ